MKKTIAHFYIHSDFGGNQQRMLDPLLYFGGCAALTACDLCIDLALHHGLEHLYPYNPKQIEIKEYRRFAGEMKTFLHPRIRGINQLGQWSDGFTAYLQSKRENGVSLTALHAGTAQARAQTALCAQIDKGIPAPFLMLNNRQKALRDYVWHWFLITGYQWEETQLKVQAATYGSARWLPFSALWNTGYEKAGGMLLPQLGKVNPIEM